MLVLNVWKGGKQERQHCASTGSCWLRCCCWPVRRLLLLLLLLRASAATSRCKRLRNVLCFRAWRRCLCCCCAAARADRELSLVGSPPGVGAAPQPVGRHNKLALRGGNGAGRLGWARDTGPERPTCKA